ncbi:MAG: T9SS C-terminal target domain-containing protein, partial [Bacteroidetes bacterium]
MLSANVMAENVKGEGKSTRKSSQHTRTGAAGCLPATAATELNLNNVRARINTGGDMWWDLQGQAKYEIPKGSSKTSMFSASLWLGGTDVNGQLKGAFQRYRGNGNDYWPGPLTTDGKASITADVCKAYDKHFVIFRRDVDNFRLMYNNSEYPDYVVPDIIKDWPANGDVSRGQSQWIAPFVDLNGNNVYEWEQGEYPYYDVNNELCKPVKDANGDYYYEPTPEGGILADQVLKGDQTIWWIFNDNGNIHSESRGNAIGVEIRAQAFAFSTNDEINNMTFYTYEIINRSTYRLTQTYFSQWVDTDLGYAYDDFVGCDVGRGLGYCYNGDNDDGLGKPDHYGKQPPAVGVDFFQGPYMDNDGIDNPKYDANGVQMCDESINGVNFGDTIIDNERFGMRRFVFHNNTGQGNPAMQDPDLAAEYYQFLRGIWKDGTKMTYGGDAHNTGGPICDFMFPDLTDDCNWGTGGVVPNPKKWTEETAGNAPYDRRFMQSAGEFTLESGAINYITVGIPWARAGAGGPFASVNLLRKIDDKAQALFDNCFKV